MLGAEHLLLPPEERSTNWRNSDYAEVYTRSTNLIMMSLLFSQTSLEQTKDKFSKTIMMAFLHFLEE